MDDDLDYNQGDDTNNNLDLNDTTVVELDDNCDDEVLYDPKYDLK